MKSAAPLVSFLGVNGLAKWRVGLLAAAVLAPTGAAFAQAGWWSYKWLHRRKVTVQSVPKTRLPGDELAVVTMPTGGLMQPGGKDIRVTTPRGTVVPHRILMVGPGDQVRLAFALRPGRTQYFVYLGNPDPGRPPAELDIRRGVLLESWTYTGGALSNLKQVRQTFQRAGQLIGRDFRRNVFLGHNPFGPQNRLCSLFTGHLTCPADGEYTFSLSSQDASFLLVDGQLVVSNGGHHYPQRRASRRGQVRLKKGPCELKVYHVNTSRNPVVVAAWQAPGAKRLWTIPPGAFAPISLAQCGMMERYGRAYQGDFIPRHAGESFMANAYFQRYRFEALVTGSAGRKEFRWTFGDGQSATAPACEHVYLRNGFFKVTLTVKLAGQTLTRANTIHVSRPWHQVTVNRLDPLADHARIVSGYDFAVADARDIGRGIALFQRAGMTEALVRAGDALVKRASAPPAVLRDAVPVYAEALLSGGEPARGVAALRKAAEMSKDPAVSAALTVQAGRAALEGGDADQAMAIFQQALKKYSALTTHPSVRDARVGTGDVWRARGDYDRAREAYLAARPVRKSGFEKQAVRRGDLTRHAEDYIRRKHFSDAVEALDRWESEFPTEKLEGFSTLLRVRLELARRNRADAADQAEQLCRVNPRSNYAPELLMLAAEAYKAMGKKDLARRTLQRIVQNYPESPLAAEAKKRIGSSAPPASGPAGGG